MLSYQVLNNKSTIKSDFLQEDIFNLLDKTFEVPAEGYEFKIFIVTKDYVARPDLIAQKLYGDTMYTDVLCKINGISNPFELNAGMMMVVPELNYIDRFVVRSVDHQDHETDDIIKPVPKKKNEKRKANEAVTGDQRFLVDPVSGIIIY